MNEQYGLELVDGVFLHGYPCATHEPGSVLSALLPLTTNSTES